MYMTDFELRRAPALRGRLEIRDCEGARDGELRMVQKQGGVARCSTRALGVRRAAGKLAGDKVPWQRRKALGTGKLKNVSKHISGSLI